MTSTMQRELQELYMAVESYGARHVHLEHFAYPASTTLHFEPSIWQDYPGSLS